MVFYIIDRQTPLTIGGHRIDLGPEGRPYGTTKVFNSQKLTDKQIRDFAQELAGGEKMKQVRPGIGIYTAKLDDGTSVTLRSVSKSRALTGARWTVDVRANPDLKNLAPKFSKVEIKFK